MEQYTEDEICTLYRQSKNKKAEIQILSDLTLLPVDNIKIILIANGFDVKKPKGDIYKYIDGITDPYDQIRILSYHGFTVVEIARALHRNVSHVSKIRKEIYQYTNRRGSD